MVWCERQMNVYALATHIKYSIYLAVVLFETAKIRMNQWMKAWVLINMYFEYNEYASISTKMQVALKQDMFESNKCG